MSSSKDRLRVLLRQHRFQNIDKTVADYNELCQLQTVLKPVVAKRTLPGGRGPPKDYVILAGTIPVNYKNSNYNIPVEIILAHTHPNNAPVMKVTPTETMEIKNTQSVDATGRVYLPYLTEWNPARSDLRGLVEVAMIAFGEQTPVYSKQRAPPRPAGPPGANSHYGHQHSGPPAYQSPSQPPYPPTSNATNGPPAAGFNLPYPVASNNQAPPFSQQSSWPQAAQPTATAATQQHGQEEQQMIRNSLVFAVEEKAKRRLEAARHQFGEELRLARHNLQQLQTGHEKLKTIKRELEQEINVTADKTSKLSIAINELDEQQRKSDGFNLETDIDTAAEAPTPLHRQILDCHCEDMALDDAVFYLGEAYANTSCTAVDLDQYLKLIREMSRRQFKARAVGMRARQKAGISTSAM